MSLKLIEDKWGKDFQKSHCKSKKTGCTVCASINCKSIILDSENINSKLKISNNMCDCVFIEQRKLLCVGVIEIKGSSFNVVHARSQLEGGINLAKHVLKTSNVHHHKIFPILAAPKFRKGAMIQMLKTCPIKIDGKPAKIFLTRCGRRLSDIVPDTYL